MSYEVIRSEEFAPFVPPVQPESVSLTSVPLKSAQPKKVRPKPVQSKLAQPKLVQPEPFQPQSVPPEVAQPGMAEPGLAQSELAQPDFAQPESVPAAVPPVPSKPPRLTMKWLNERIGELQADNRLLTERIEQLEKLLERFQPVRLDTDAAPSPAENTPEAADAKASLALSVSESANAGTSAVPWEPDLAAAVQSIFQHEQEAAAAMEPDVFKRADSDGLIPRSERHVTPKKKKSYFRGWRGWLR